jgi:hypothetical protein
MAEENDLPVPEDVVSALMTLRLDPAGFKVFRLTQAAKDALAVHLPGVEMTSGGDTESFRRGNARASLFIPDELLEAHDPPIENNANAPENVLRRMVVVAPDGPVNKPFLDEILDALLAAKRDLVPPEAGLGAGRRRRHRKTRKGKGKRKTTRRRM